MAFSRQHKLYKQTDQRRNENIKQEKTRIAQAVHGKSKKGEKVKGIEQRNGTGKKIFRPKEQPGEEMKRQIRAQKKKSQVKRQLNTGTDRKKFQNIQKTKVKQKTWISNKVFQEVFPDVDYLTYVS